MDLWVCQLEGRKTFVGIDDNGNIKGIENYRILLEQLPNKFRDMLGVYAVINLQGKPDSYYLEIEVPYYEVPISYKGKYYIRSGSTLQELKGIALNDFLLKKAGKSWDAVLENSNFDLNLKTLDHFKAMASDRLPGLSAEKDNSVVLSKLNLGESGKLRRAALLLFGKEVQHTFMQAIVKIGKFVSNTEIISSDIVEGNLFQQLERTLDLLRTKYLLSPITYEGIHRREKLEIPYVALREAIINALIHRTYATSSAIQIKILEGNVQITNEGSLPPGMLPRDLKKNHLSNPRNRYLADIFYKAGLIESWGRGTIKIVEACVNAGLPEPEYEIDEHTFSINFFMAKKHITEQVTEQVRKLLICLKKTMSASDIMEQLNLKHRPTFLYNYLKPAIDKGLVEMTVPEKPNSRFQKYRLSDFGEKLKNQIDKT